MIIEVEMHAFANGAIRRVEIPDNRILHDVPETLGAAFELGQNDFQPQDLPSVSVGDIIRCSGERYAVMPIGFRRIEPNFIPPHDGGMWAYRFQAMPDQARYRGHLGG